MEEEISIKAIVVNENKQILILTRSENGKLDLPGGHLDDGETHYHTLLREMNEEIGVKDILVHPDFHESIHWINSKQRLRIIHIYVVKIDSPISLSDEHSEYKWVSCDELESYFPYNKNKGNPEELLQKIQAFLQTLEV